VFIHALYLVTTIAGPCETGYDALK